MTEIKYADTSSWEEWQKEYRYGAFYIFPPKEIIHRINELRQKYDPKSNSYCQAHVSLSEPLKNELTEERLQELKNVLLSIDPFDIHYGALRSFAPYPGVAYAIQPEDKFMRLRSAIHSTSLFRAMTLKRAHVAPHITIAEFISIERTNDLLQELTGNVPDGSFLCRSIEYAVPNEQFYFERVFTIPLGASSKSYSCCSDSGPAIHRRA